MPEIVIMNRGTHKKFRVPYKQKEGRERSNKNAIELSLNIRLSTFPPIKTERRIEKRMVCAAVSFIANITAIITKMGAIDIAFFLLNKSSSKASSIYFSPPPIIAKARIITI
ncbi:MAG: hypothetical protein N2V78_01385 [Methanophagales archaeon]|nr:hypothetical protein [Methanophagales archaeon]